MICVWWLNDSKVLEKILKINTCTCIPYKLEFRDIVVHVCPGKVLKFAIKTFSKRRLFLYMIVHVYQKLFSRDCQNTIATKAKRVNKIKLPVNVQLQQTEGQNYIQWTKINIKTEKKLKEKIQIYVFNKCILNPAKFSNRILNIGAKFTMGVLFFLAWQRATGTKINGIPHIFLTWVGLFGDLHGKTQMSILCI